MYGPIKGEFNVSNKLSQIVNFYIFIQCLLGKLAFFFYHKVVLHGTSIRDLIGFELSNFPLVSWNWTLRKVLVGSKLL